MARKLFEVQGVRRREGDLATGIAYQVYLEEAASNLADISASSGGSSIGGSTVTVADIAGLGPAALRWWGPTNDTDELYLKCPADPTLPVQRVEAVTDPRLDALEGIDTEGRLDLLEGMVVNAKAPPYNAVGDGLAEDHAALQDAIDDLTGAADPAGGTVYLPKGTYLLGAQLKVKHGVRLLGAGKRATTLKAIPAFTPSTPLVRLGHGAGVAFDAALYHLTVDTVNVAGSVGVYSNEAQEGAGVFHCLVRNTRGVGIDLATGSENCGVVDTEVLPVTGTGIRTAILGAGYCERVTIAEITGSGTLANAIENSAILNCKSIHVERCTNGVYFTGASAQGTVNGLIGHNSVTNLMRCDAAAYHWTLLDAFTSGGTNILLDGYNGITLPATDVDRIALYNPREVFLGAVKWRSGTGTPEGAVAGRVGSIFIRTDGGASTTLYLKETGTGNTGWRAV